MTLDALLRELAEAELDCREHHHVRYPEVARCFPPIPWVDQSTECRADWTRCYRRRDAAIAALTELAIRVVAAESTHAA